MTRSTCGALLMVVLLVSSAGSQSARRKAPAAEPQGSRAADDKAAIGRLQERAIAANVAFDVTALVALWAEDGVLLAPQHEPIIGKSQLRGFYEAQHEAQANAEVLAYEEQWQEVRMVGDYAFQWGQVRSRTRSGQTKAENSVVLNAMRVLKREADGGWVIARAVYNEAHAGTSIGSGTLPPGERR